MINVSRIKSAIALHGFAKVAAEVGKVQGQPVLTEKIATDQIKRRAVREGMAAMIVLKGHPDFTP